MSSSIVPTVEILNGKLMVSSLNIAEVFGKRHNNILRDIENEKKFFTGLNFELSEYYDSTGRALQMYLIDDEFTTFLIMGFTGQKAKEFKLSYIREFNRMRNLLNNQDKIKELQDKIKELQGLLTLQSKQLTEQTIETNKIKEEKKSKSNYYEQIEEIDIFGNKNIKYQYIPRDKELLYKLDCCENTAKGCIINGNKYIKELKEMGILITKSLFILPHRIPK